MTGHGPKHVQPSWFPAPSTSTHACGSATDPVIPIWRSLVSNLRSFAEERDLSLPLGPAHDSASHPFLLCSRSFLRCGILGTFVKVPGRVWELSRRFPRPVFYVLFLLGFILFSIFFLLFIFLCLFLSFLFFFLFFTISFLCLHILVYKRSTTY